PFADLYATGVVLFQMLSGTLPFEDPDREALLQKHRTEPAPRLSSRVPGVPQGLDDLVDALLSKTPMGRPVDAHATAARIEALAAELGANVTPPPIQKIAGPAPGADLAQIQARWE